MVDKPKVKLPWYQRFLLRRLGKRLRRMLERGEQMSAFPKLFGYVSILAAVVSAIAEYAQVLPANVGKIIVMLSTVLASFSHSIPPASAAGIKLPSWFGTLASIASVAAGFGLGGPIGLAIGIISTVIAAISRNVVGTPTPPPAP